jgi:hypothetical protein
MVKLTMPGLAAVELPLAVFSVSQPAPGSSVAVQFTVGLPFTLTRNDPFGLPGAPPADIWNCAPAGFSVMVVFWATASVTGTVAEPAEVLTSTLLW